MFTEQLVVRRKKDGPPGAWEAPIAQTKPLDDAVNAWVDQTGNDIVSVTSPSMFMQWMDGDRTMRLVIVSVMVTYVPALSPPKPLIRPDQEKPDAGQQARVIPAGWEPVTPDKQ